MGRRLSGGTMDENGLKETKKNLWHDVCTRGCEGEENRRKPFSINPLFTGGKGMKKLFIMALAAIFAANISAQEAKAGKAECKKENKECQHRKKCKMSFEERTEMEIKFLSDELYLDSLQAEKFANTFRDFRKAQLAQGPQRASGRESAAFPRRTSLQGRWTFQGRRKTSSGR